MNKEPWCCCFPQCTGENTAAPHGRELGRTGAAGVHQPLVAKKKSEWTGPVPSYATTKWLRETCIQNESVRWQRWGKDGKVLIINEELLHHNPVGGARPGPDIHDAAAPALASNAVNRDLQGPRLVASVPKGRPHCRNTCLIARPLQAPGHIQNLSAPVASKHKALSALKSRASVRHCS